MVLYVALVCKKSGLFQKIIFQVMTPVDLTKMPSRDHITDIAPRMLHNLIGLRYLDSKPAESLIKIRIWLIKIQIQI